MFLINVSKIKSQNQMFYIDKGWNGAYNNRI